MQTFELYIQDTRSSVPTLVFVAVASPRRARARAEAFLSESPCHLEVEVCRGGKHLFTVTPGERPHSPKVGARRRRPSPPLPS